MILILVTCHVPARVGRADRPRHHKDAIYLIANSSTSKTKVASGGMVGGLPVRP